MHYRLVISFRRFAIGLLALCAAVNGAREATARERYVVHFEDGQRVETDKLLAWPLPHTSAKIEGKDVFGANRAVLVRDQRAKPRLASPALVMANGDVLTGVIRQLDPSAIPGESPWLQVQPEGDLLPVDGLTVSVRADRVRRIVAQGRPISPEPAAGTVVLADGRQMVARSIRWRPYGLAMLTENGIVEVTYAELADVVLPGVDVLRAVAEDNLWAGREGKSILRFTLAGGGILTASAGKRVEERSRNRGRPRIDVYYQVQPAWARQAIAVAEESIAWCGFRRVDEAPLSLLPSRTLADRRLIAGNGPGSGATASDEVVPRTGHREADLAIAAHSHSEIAFDLSQAARSLNLTVGLAQGATNGGCVVCKIFADSVDGKLLWESGFLTGADEPKSTGDLDLTGVQRVVLVTEFGHEGRPEGADPLDIRDDVRWLRPVVKLDLQALQSGPSLGSLLRGLELWTTSEEELRDASIDVRWSELHERWEPTLVIPKGKQITLTRKVRIDRGCDVLELTAECPPTDDAIAMQVAVDEEAVEPSLSHERASLRKQYDTFLPQVRRGRGKQRLSERSFDDTLAWWWDLAPWRGKEVTVTVTLSAKNKEGRIAWRNLALRSAIGNLPASRELPKVDVPLTSAKPVEVAASKERTPTKDTLPGRRAEAIRFLGQKMTGGYGMVRESHVTFELKPEYRRFVAVVGAVVASSGPYEVRVDENVVWRREAMDVRDPAELVEIDLPAGAKQLTIAVGADGGYGGHAGWAEAGFVVER